MKNTKEKIEEKPKAASGIVAFRPSDAAIIMLEEWDKTGYDRTVLINNLLVKFGPKAAKELTPLLEQVGISKRMVRGRGFEPLTPTVSRSGPDSAVNSQFSQDFAQEKASGIRIVLENNRLHVKPLQGKQPVPIGGTCSPPPCPARIAAGGPPFCQRRPHHHHN